MILSEQEAKAKVCPHMLLNSYTSIHQHHGNSVAGHKYSTCIASVCMAWRRLGEDYVVDGAPRGYCGLAGRPD